MHLVPSIANCAPTFQSTAADDWRGSNWSMSSMSSHARSEADRSLTPKPKGKQSIQPFGGQWPISKKKSLSTREQRDLVVFPSRGSRCFQTLNSTHGRENARHIRRCATRCFSDKLGKISSSFTRNFRTLSGESRPRYRSAHSAPQQRSQPFFTQASSCRSSAICLFDTK